MRVAAINPALKTASYRKSSSFFERWLQPVPVPERLIVKPVDVWPGVPARAERIIQTVDFMQDWPAGLHDFTWLRDLSAYAGIENIKQARTCAQDAIAAWIMRYRRKAGLPWQADITGQRIAMWSAFFELFGDEAEEDFQDRFFESMAAQAAHLSKVLTRCRSSANNTKRACASPGLSELSVLYAAKGLLYAGIGFEGQDEWTAQALDLLERAIAAQILPDGGHISRSPALTLEALQVFLDVRTALHAAGQAVPDSLSDAVQRCSKAIQYMRYHDKGLAVFHAAQEGDKGLIDRILAQAGVRGKMRAALPDTGYTRIQRGRTMIMADTGGRAPAPYGAHGHRAPLAFEMTYARHRVLVSCGTHSADPAWQGALSAAAAHTAVSIGGQDMMPETVDCTREDTDPACLVTMSHAGYVPLNGLSHTRRLYVADEGHDVRGDDAFSFDTDPLKAVPLSIRFHIHPRVMVSLIRTGQEALLRVPGGIGWRFSHAGGRLSLEDSVYLGEGDTPRKTKQLVICGDADTPCTVIKWRLSREG